MKDFARIYLQGNRWKADYLGKTYTFLKDMSLGEIEKDFADRGISTIRETERDVEEMEERTDTEDRGDMFSTKKDWDKYDKI